MCTLYGNVRTNTGGVESATLGLVEPIHLERQIRSLRRSESAASHNHRPSMMPRLWQVMEN